jgi:hypothetical protein
MSDLPQGTRLAKSGKRYKTRRHAEAIAEYLKSVRRSEPPIPMGRGRALGRHV